MSIGKTSGLEKTVKSTLAISVSNTIAKFGADDDTMSLAVASSDEMIGVFQHTTSVANELVRVMLSGISDLKIAGTITRGNLITSNSQGRGIAAAQHTHIENTNATYAQNATTATAAPIRIIGRALKSGITGDIIPVLLGPAIA